MDPVGPQKTLEVKGDRRAGQPGQKNIQKTVLLHEVDVPNTNYTSVGGDYNGKAHTRKADTPKMWEKWQGTVKGKQTSNHKNEGTLTKSVDSLKP